MFKNKGDRTKSQSFVVLEKPTMKPRLNGTELCKNYFVCSLFQARVGFCVLFLADFLF